MKRFCLIISILFGCCTIYTMHISDDFSIDDASEEGTEDRSYSSGNYYEKKIRLEDGKDLANYIYDKRKFFLKKSNTADKNTHKKLLFNSLAQQVKDEDHPKGSETGNLVYDNKELLKISPQAIIDLLIYIDEKEHIQRPGGVSFYSAFKKYLRQTKQNEPQRYQDFTFDIMKKMMGKYSKITRDISKENNNHIKEIINNENNKKKLEIDTSYIISKINEAFSGNNSRSSNKIMPIVNMFHTIVSNHKEQEQEIRTGQLEQQIELWQTLPHEQIEQTHRYTQKVNQGTQTNFKTQIISGILVVLTLGLEIYTTITGCTGSSQTNSTVV